ncbi:B3 domain-containing protein, partial [Cephalotus follicularis]
ASKLSYEECRSLRIEENKKRMEALNLPLLSQALRNSSPKPSPSKKLKPRTMEKQVVVVRRSGRVASKPTPVYKEVCHFFFFSPQNPHCIFKRRDLSNRVYASDDARAEATEKAEKLLAGLEPDYPNFVKPMLQSHVTGGFWLGLQREFCRRNLPKHDVVITLIDEDGDEYPTVYLPRKTGLSGGWKGFAVAHKLVDGDALVFQLIRPTVFKV